MTSLLPALWQPLRAIFISVSLCFGLSRLYLWSLLKNYRCLINRKYEQNQNSAEYHKRVNGIYRGDNSGCFPDYSFPREKFQVDLWGLVLSKFCLSYRQLWSFSVPGICV